MRRDLTAALALLSIATIRAGAQSAPDAWVPLFNGHDLSGWTIKIRGSETGEDPQGTFSVRDGLISVDYANYESFDDRFGHLFYERPFGDYHLRIEYRFIGEQVADGPGWAFKNSGVMFHSQSPQSMLRGQDFPISLEAQFLGGNGVDDRPTANLCTPGTHVDVDGVRVEEHCISSTAPTFHGDEWVTVEVISRAGAIAHLVNGDTVLAYTRPVIGGTSVDGYDLAEKRDGERLTGGYIALQSESHPIQFRSIMIRELDRENR